MAIDVSGIGNQLSSIYQNSSSDQATINEFQKILESAVETSEEATTLSNLEDAELKEACQEFEAYYIQQLFKEMRKTIPDGGLFESSSSMDIYEEMLDGEYSTEMSQRSSVGIADALYRQLSQGTGSE